MPRKKLCVAHERKKTPFDQLGQLLRYFFDFFDIVSFHNFRKCSIGSKEIVFDYATPLIKISHQPNDSHQKIFKSVFFDVTFRTIHFKPTAHYPAKNIIALHTSALRHKIDKSLLPYSNLRKLIINSSAKICGNTWPSTLMRLTALTVQSTGKISLKTISKIITLKKLKINTIDLIDQRYLYKLTNLTELAIRGNEIIMPLSRSVLSNAEPILLPQNITTLKIEFCMGIDPNMFQPAPFVQNLLLANSILYESTISTASYPNLSSLILKNTNISRKHKYNKFKINCESLQSLEIIGGEDYHDIDFDNLTRLTSLTTQKVSITSFYNKLKHLPQLRLLKVALIVLPCNSFEDALCYLPNLRSLAVISCNLIGQLPLRIKWFHRLKNLCIHGCGNCNDNDSLAHMDLVNKWLMAEFERTRFVGPPPTAKINFFIP
ncbi:MAG: hypothetical protein Harvfovirus25_10 [Harvfovirus sp.]|uniref:Uncharacterized protein n=1 Tax=Harvfovirus sp. TaxID=2487768 RepID=A0A3G5A4Z3_9VIRU|nr:MAG: hypothetical protein Harvfovirus25_10 [Harvfovirus sp.]